MVTSTQAVEEDRFEVVLRFSVTTGIYVARAPEMPVCASWGKIQEEAVWAVRKAIRSNIDSVRACGAGA